MKNNAFLLLSALIIVFFSGCIIVNKDFDIHIARFNNASSHNIYIQHYSRNDNDLKSDYFSAYGISIPQRTIANYAAPLYDSEPYLKKILIVDTDTHKLLKKITPSTYFYMLTSPEIVVENNTDGGKTTNYYYYFVITDEFLNGN
jgi:hypothetical protein